MVQVLRSAMSMGMVWKIFFSVVCFLRTNCISTGVTGFLRTSHSVKQFAAINDPPARSFRTWMAIKIWICWLEVLVQAFGFLPTMDQAIS